MNLGLKINSIYLYKKPEVTIKYLTVQDNKPSDFPSPSKLCSPNDDSMTSTSASEKKKKARTTFTGRQIFELEKQFEVKKYLSLNERAKMASLLNVTETQVKII